MKTVTSLPMFATLLLVANAQAGPQASQKPMDHGKMKMEHAGMQMPATPEARAKMANTCSTRSTPTRMAVSAAPNLSRTIGPCRWTMAA